MFVKTIIALSLAILAIAAPQEFDGTIMDPHFNQDPPFDHFKYLHQNGPN